MNTNLIDSCTPFQQNSEAHMMNTLQGVTRKLKHKPTTLAGLNFALKFQSSIRIIPSGQTSCFPFPARIVEESNRWRGVPCTVFGWQIGAKGNGNACLFQAGFTPLVEQLYDTSKSLNIKYLLACNQRVMYIIYFSDHLSFGSSFPSTVVVQIRLSLLCFLLI